MEFKQQQNLFWKRILRQEFAKRCKKNPSYSLRAFANFLDLDQSLLTKVLNDKRNVSTKMLTVISSKLKISPYEMTSLKKEMSLNEYNFIGDDQVNLLSHWYYMPILEFFKIKEVIVTSESISKCFNIHKQEAQSALDVLTGSGLISLNGDSYKLEQKNNSWTDTKVTSLERTALQKEYVEKSLQALELVDFEKRDASSLTVAINSKKLPEIKIKMAELRRELDQFIEQTCEGEGYDEVYQLSMSFFPLTQLKNNKESNHE